MVEKIDRPEVAPTYQVVATTPAKDERGQSQQQPQPEDEFSSPGARMEWEKFHGPVQDRLLVRFERENIRNISFRRATFSPRAIIVETDLELASGKLWRGAQFLIPHLDELTKWKGFLPGQAIPLAEIVREATVEVSVPHRRPTPREEDVRRGKAPGTSRQGEHLTTLGWILKGTRWFGDDVEKEYRLMWIASGASILFLVLLLLIFGL